MTQPTCAVTAEPRSVRFRRAIERRALRRDASLRRAEYRRSRSGSTREERDGRVRPADSAVGHVPTGRKLASPDPRPRGSFGVLLDATEERLRYCRDRYRERDEAEFTFAGTNAIETETGRAFTVVTSGDAWVLAEAAAARVSCFVERGGKVVFLREAGDDTVTTVRVGTVGAVR